MKTTIVANTVAFQSAVAFDTFKELERFQPSALTLVDADKHPVLTATVAGNGRKGSITNRHIVFDPEADAGGKAVLTIMLPFNEIADKKQYIAENYGMAIMKMNELELQIADAANNLAARIASVRNNIEEV